MSFRAAAIVVHFGPDAMCIACARSAMASRDVDVIPVIVDHNSAPSPCLEAEARSLGGTYAWNGANPGFAAGANAGIRAVAGRGRFDLLVLLNPDTRLDPGCLSKLASVVREDPSIGVVGPGLLSEANPETWWNAGSEIAWPSAKPRSVLHGRRRGEKDVDTVDTGFVCGSVMALPPATIEMAGFLREDFFLYFEDADYCHRARAVGLRTVVCRQALAWHAGGGSSRGLEDETEYYRVRNRLRFSRAWNPYPIRGKVHRSLFALRALLRSGFAFVRAPRREALLPARAVRDDFLGRSGKLPGRPGESGG